MSDTLEKYVDNICCCCGHSLDHHVDEGTGWRCHSLGRDFYQCECFLRKDRYEDGIKGYDLQKRIDSYEKETREGGLS
jgi:hypothetical protein